METEDGYVFGPGAYSLLKKVNEVGTLKEAATELGMSYRYAWGLIRKAEEKLGEPLLVAHKGGKSGGGGAEISERGREFLKEFQKLREQMTLASEVASSQFVHGTVKDIKANSKGIEIIVRTDVEDKTSLKKGDSVNIRVSD